MASDRYVPKHSDLPTATTPWFVFEPLDFRFLYFRSEEECQQYFEAELRPLYRDEVGRRYCPDLSWALIGRVSYTVDCDGAYTCCQLQSIEGVDE